MDNNGRVIIVKVGTAPLTHSTGMLNIRKIEHLCRVICDLENSGANMILVSSGAVSPVGSRWDSQSAPTQSAKSRRRRP